jgi:hypothetical protein
MEGSCEHGDETSGSRNFGEYFEKISKRLAASEKGLSSMELVNYNSKANGDAQYEPNTNNF